MPRFNKIPVWAPVAIIGALAIFFTFYVPTIHPHVSHLAAARNFLFWAAVTAPVAYLADMLIRTAISYPTVQRAVVRRRD